MAPPTFVVPLPSRLLAWTASARRRGEGEGGASRVIVSRIGAHRGAAAGAAAQGRNAPQSAAAAAAQVNLYAASSAYSPPPQFHALSSPPLSPCPQLAGSNVAKVVIEDCFKWK